MTKFSNSLFSFCCSVLTSTNRLFTLQTRGRPANHYILSGWQCYSTMNTRYAVSCWVFSGFPEVGVMLSAGLLLALQTAAATDLMQWKSSATRRN